MAGGGATATATAEKVYVGLEGACGDARERVLGARGSNLDYIRSETGAEVTLRGRGSLRLEPALGREAPDDLHLLIEHARPDALRAARRLAEDLVATLRESVPPPPIPQPRRVEQSHQYRQAPPVQTQARMGEAPLPPPLPPYAPPHAFAQFLSRPPPPVQQQQPPPQQQQQQQPPQQQPHRRRFYDRSPRNERGRARKPIADQENRRYSSGDDADDKGHLPRNGQFDAKEHSGGSRKRSDKSEHDGKASEISRKRKYDPENWMSKSENGQSSATEPIAVYKSRFEPEEPKNNMGSLQMQSNFGPSSKIFGPCSVDRDGSSNWMEQTGEHLRPGMNELQQHEDAASNMQRIIDPCKNQIGTEEIIDQRNLHIGPPITSWPEQRTDMNVTLQYSNPNHFQLPEGEKQQFNPVFSSNYSMNNMNPVSVYQNNVSYLLPPPPPPPPQTQNGQHIIQYNVPPGSIGVISQPMTLQNPTQNVPINIVSSMASHLVANNPMPNSVGRNVPFDIVGQNIMTQAAMTSGHGQNIMSQSLPPVITHNNLQQHHQQQQHMPTMTIQTQPGVQQMLASSMGQTTVVANVTQTMMPLVAPYMTHSMATGQMAGHPIAHQTVIGPPSVVSSMHQSLPAVLATHNNIPSSMVAGIMSPSVVTAHALPMSIANGMGQLAMQPMVQTIGPTMVPPPPPPPQPPQAMIAAPQQTMAPPNMTSALVGGGGPPNMAVAQPNMSVAPPPPPTSMQHAMSTHQTYPPYWMG